jgi:hypothetical protein
VPERAKLLAASQEVHTLELEQLRQPLMILPQPTHAELLTVYPTSHVVQTVELEQLRQLVIMEEQIAQAPPLR